MMKTRLFLLLCCLLTRDCFSQDIFVKFVESRKIQFATQLPDTFHFGDPNLSLLIRQRLSRENIKAVLPTEEKTGNKIKYARPEEIRARIAPNKEVKVIDEDGNVTATVVESEDPLFAARYFDEQTRDMVEIPQVIYIESGKLRSYIPYFSTKYAVSTSWGQKLGISNAFNTGYNKNRKLSSRVKRRSKLLAGTKTLVRLDTVQSQNLLKQLYGQNLLQALWPHFHKKQFEIYRMDSMIKIPFEKLNMGLVSQINVPVYSEDGTLEGSTKFPVETLPLLPAAVGEMQVVQNWFYNERKNILFSNITELLLFPASNFSQSVPQGKPVLKILLK